MKYELKLKKHICLILSVFVNVLEEWRNLSEILGESPTISALKHVYLYQILYSVFLWKSLHQHQCPCILFGKFVIAFNLDFNQEIILHFYKCQKSFANASNIFFIMLRYIYVIRIAPGKSFTVYLIVHVYTCKIINFFYIDNHLQRS